MGKKGKKSEKGNDPKPVEEPEPDEEERSSWRGSSRLEPPQAPARGNADPGR